MLLLLGALAAVPTAARGADAEVTIKNTAFTPQGVTVPVGGEVVWKDEEGGHDVTFDDGSFKEPPACTAAGLVGCTQKGDRIERTFDKAGAFKYHCSRHGTGMSGLVNVQAGASEVTTTTVPATATTQPPTTVTTASTTTTTRKLATSSTLAPTTTSTAPAESSTTVTPNEAPAFDPGDGGNGGGGSDEASPAGSGGGGGDSGPGTVALIVAALLAVAGGGGVLLWRLRPRSAQP
jgi:plastocyanin